MSDDGKTLKVGNKSETIKSKDIVETIEFGSESSAAPRVPMHFFFLQAPRSRSARPRLPLCNRSLLTHGCDAGKVDGPR